MSTTTVRSDIVQSIVDGGFAVEEIFRSEDFRSEDWFYKGDRRLVGWRSYIHSGVRVVLEDGDYVTIYAFNEHAVMVGKVVFQGFTDLMVPMALAMFEQVKDS